MKKKSARKSAQDKPAAAELREPAASESAVSEPSASEPIVCEPIAAEPAAGWLDHLNAAQRAAVTHGLDPLLIIAGAGSGKTTTLVHRVAGLIGQGIDSRRILLLTFTRRAAGEMLRRVEGVLEARAKLTGDSLSSYDDLTRRPLWGGTFHAVAAGLLRLHGPSIGLPPGFTIHDRSDSEDLLDLVRTDLKLGQSEKRFPKKGTCLDIYSRSVNSRERLDKLLEENYPWCQDYAAELKKLFQGYVDRKSESAVCDYDDLLLFWLELLEEPTAAAKLQQMFDAVLVDEYQDTNQLQGEILQKLCPLGTGLTAVGDDAQSIYSFRAATVRNILDFPKQFPGTTIVKLEQNYRSTTPILEATNRVIAQAVERYPKNLWSERAHGEKPKLITCQDDYDQASWVVRQVLDYRERGIDLKRQAVLFRSSFHSIALEAELTRRNIPFTKYGGLKFLEAAHVKDFLSFLRLAENPLDPVAGPRVLRLLPGFGPAKARDFCRALTQAGGNFEAWQKLAPPKSAAQTWPVFLKLMKDLHAERSEVPRQVHRVRMFYEPLLEAKYDHAQPRLRDLEQIELLSSRYPDRMSLLAELTLDPPNSTQDLAGPPALDEDYLILSTIHSAKGLEWDAVYVIHAADGNIPSDMATKSPEQLEEELRLFYVALSRAKDHLAVCFPLRYYQSYGKPSLGQFSFAQLTRFLSKSVLKCFERQSAQMANSFDATGTSSSPSSIQQNARRKHRQFWD